MTMLERWVAAFEAMDDQARRDNLRFLEGSARRNPRHKTPILKLIHNPASNLAAGGIFGKPNDFGAPPRVAPVVKIK